MLAGAAAPNRSLGLRSALATLARLAILLSVSASYPLFMFIARSSVSQVALGKLPKDTSTAEYLGITLALFGAWTSTLSLGCFSPLCSAL